MAQAYGARRWRRSSASAPAAACPTPPPTTPWRAPARSHEWAAFACGRAQRRRLQRPGARPPAPTNGLLLHAGVPNAAAYNALARARPLPRMGCFCMRACPTPPRTTPWRAPASCNECAASSCDVPRDAVMDSCVQCSGAQALALALGLLCHAMWPKMLSRSARPPARVRAGQARRRDRSPGCPRAPATPPLPAPMSRRMPGRVCAGQQPNGSLARDCT